MLAVIREYMDQLMMIDIWRQLNPEDRMYTYAKHKPKYSASRIDFFLLNYGLTGNAKANITPITSMYVRHQGVKVYGS